MANYTKHLKYLYKYANGTIEGTMKIDLSRFPGQYTRAQYELDTMVMNSMIPYMPKQTGTFINVTQAMSQAIAGSGKVVAAAPPMGRFLYEGVAMVGERTRSAFAEKGEKKVTTGIPLKYSTHANPKASARWFDVAKNNHGKTWIEKTKKLAGGG